MKLLAGIMISPATVIGPMKFTKRALLILELTELLTMTRFLQVRKTSKTIMPMLEQMTGIDN